MSANVQEFPDDQARMLRAARAYVEKGWAVFPLYSIGADGQCNCGTPQCVDAGKHPRIAKGVKGASKEVAQIEEWWGPDAPLSNIGVATGNISGITVLDVDTADGKPGAATWAELIKEGGEPDTLTARTGSGGFHMFFAYNSAMKTSSNTLGPGVDCRSDGGYVVMTPSKHRSGGRYSWENWSVAEVAALPSHLTRKKEKRGRPRKDDYTRGKYSLEQVRAMLEVIPATDRDDWRHFGIILGREFAQSDEAWEMYCDWADKEGGKKGRNHDEIMREAFYTLSQEEPAEGAGRSLGTIVKMAMEHGWAPQVGDVPKEQFVYFGPGNNFIYRPTCTHWQAAAVDAACSPVNIGGKIQKASEWLKVNALASSMTSAPELDTDYLKGSDCRNGELIESPGAALYNTYRRPTISGGDASMASPFLEHVKRVFPGPAPRPGDLTDAEQFLAYMAHRVQHPEQKPRFALLLAGEMGTGKDTAFEFCIPAIGAWNVANIAPSALDGSFNEYCASTIVRISEAANLQEMNKWAFNERTKTLIAGNPDVETVNPKYGQKYSVRLYCGVVLTTNHLADGIYIPPGDRRYDVIQSATLAEMGIADEDKKVQYFEELWDWFNKGGDKHVAAYLQELDISRFRPSTGQRKTDAHKKTVQMGHEGDEWLTDAIEEIGKPRLLRLDWVVEAAVQAGKSAGEIKSRIKRAMSRTDYVYMHNPESKDGRWYLESGNKKRWMSIWFDSSQSKPEKSDWDQLAADRF